MAKKSCPAIAVIIPALNEQESLPRVLRDLPWPILDQVIVVDNGSTDRTAQGAVVAGARVVHEPRRGYGQACLTGLAALGSDVSKGREPDIVVFLDADYSDHPDELPEVVQPILDGRADFVVGSRICGQREPGALLPQSLWGNRLACWLMKILFGAGYTDLGPFRAIRYETLRSLGMEDTNFGWTVEMQLKAARLGVRALEVPVSYRRRIGNSKITGTLSGTVKAGAKILYLIAKYGLCGIPNRSDATQRPAEADRAGPHFTGDLPGDRAAESPVRLRRRA